MNTQIDRNMQADIDTDLLKCIEGAVTQRTLTAHADEARYGFVARITNATPPTN